MIEDIIVQLDELGVPYEEDMESGSLTVDVGSLDKVALIEVIQVANDSGLEFTIDESSMIITGGAPMDMGEDPMATGEDEVDMQAAAFEEMF